MVKWTEGDIDVQGINLHFYRTGKGDKPALVLAHGFSDNGLCWFRVARELENQFDIVMPDARNHGQSDRVSSGDNLSDSEQTPADDLAGLITALGLKQPQIVGHSMGASTVAEMAARYPDMAARIVLEDPPWTVKQPGASAEVPKARRDGFRQFLQALGKQSDDEALAYGQKLNPLWHDDDFPAWVDSKRQVSEHAMAGLSMGGWQDIVPLIRCPSLLVYADDQGDGLVTAKIAEAVRTLNPSFTSACIAGAGHNIRREQFDVYLETVSNFLSEPLKR